MIEIRCKDFSLQQVYSVLNGEIKDIPRHILLYFGPKRASVRQLEF